MLQPSEMNSCKKMYFKHFSKSFALYKLHWSSCLFIADKMWFFPKAQCYAVRGFKLILLFTINICHNWKGFMKIVDRNNIFILSHFNSLYDDPFVRKLVNMIIASL